MIGLMYMRSFAFVVYLFGATTFSTAQGLDSVPDDSLEVNGQTEDLNDEGNPNESEIESKKLSRSIGAIKDHGKVKIGTFQSIHCEGLLKHNGRKIREATYYTPDLGMFTQLKCSGLEDYLNSKFKPFKGFDCLAIQKHYGGRRLYSGIYTIYPKADTGLDVYCEMEKDGGGWTVIQRRFNGKESFHRNWKEYKDGFGKKSEEYWLGNDNIHKLTSNGTCRLRIDMKDSNNAVRYAKYGTFKISDERGKYKLAISAMSTGDVYHDAMKYHNGRPFSTKDKDNDSYKANCAASAYGYGGWWFGACHEANLNGMYKSGQTTGARYNLWYQVLKKHHDNLLKSAMMIKCN